jgi:hypothetical protein
VTGRGRCHSWRRPASFRAGSQAGRVGSAGRLDSLCDRDQVRSRFGVRAAEAWQRTGSSSRLLPFLTQAPSFNLPGYKRRPPSQNRGRRPRRLLSLHQPESFQPPLMALQLVEAAGCSRARLASEGGGLRTDPALLSRRVRIWDPVTFKADSRAPGRRHAPVARHGRHLHD